MAFRLVPLYTHDSFWHDPLFASEWSGFDLFRRNMLRDCRDVFDELHRQLECPDGGEQKAPDSEGKDSEGKKKGKQDEQGRTIAPMPATRHLLRMFHDDEGAYGDEQLIKLKDEDDKFQVGLDTHHYKPDQIKVVVDDEGMLKIEGKHEEKSDDGHRVVSRQFVRQYKLPSGCKKEAVVSNLSSDGVLMITAPKDQSAVGGPRVVPIEQAK